MPAIHSKFQRKRTEMVAIGGNVIPAGLLCRVLDYAGAADSFRLQLVNWAFYLEANEVRPWDKGACLEAAEAGNLPMLKWLRTGPSPCPWSAGDICEAAYMSYLKTKNPETLFWLRHHGKDGLFFGTDVFEGAEYYGWPKGAEYCLKWKYNPNPFIQHVFNESYHYYWGG